ncbi:MAG: hypothetical protein RLZ12_558 [Bacillota bacterium]|jgi:dGTPase
MIIYNLANKNKFYQPKDWERRRETIGSDFEDPRDPFEKDYGRIIHSSSFRRLQAKTQIVGLGAGDFHRTRLTHSLEVAQIARGIVIKLNAGPPFVSQQYLIDASLVEAAALAHDLGHPPFGHFGEDSLNICMADYGGFEGNAHTFRILTHLAGNGRIGLNVTRALLLSVMKYPILLDDKVFISSKDDLTKDFITPKVGAFLCDKPTFDWVLDRFTTEEQAYFTQTKLISAEQMTCHKTLESSIIELADDIAYGTHDIEDSLCLKMVSTKDLALLLEPFAENDEYPQLKISYQQLCSLSATEELDKYIVKQVLSEIIAAFITKVDLEEVSPKFSERLRYQVKLPQLLQDLLAALHKLVAEKVIDSQRIRIANSRGGFVIKRLFEAMMNYVKLLPIADRELLQRNNSESYRARVVCDYIAGMTDSFALAMHEHLFGGSSNHWEL